MKIFVCIKHVPDTAANITVTGATDYDESVKFIINPYDEYAVEEASKIAKASGGEVVALTVGKETAMNTLRSALAVGADRGILVKSDALFLDPMSTAKALKAVIEKDGAPDLIFTGKQSVDSEGMQTPYRLAAELDMPVVNEVVALSVQDGKITVEREVGTGQREVLEVSMPCVVGATKGLNEPRYPKLPDIMKAKKKRVDQMDLNELGLDPSENSIELTNLEMVPERGGAKIIEGDTRSAVTELVRLLKEESKVL
jgi:electron transfer flavoprotein beta subunit